MDCNGQSPGAQDSSHVVLLSVAREVIQATPNCALITLDGEGRARVRAMDAFLPDENWVVWLATRPKSRKVAQINEDPRVTLYYFDHTNPGYVMIYGQAELVENAQQKNEHWKEGWEEFYPNPKEDLLLIKVTPQWMEVLSTKHQILGDSVTWQPKSVQFE
ncbi:MAG: pyridoxamine 5'-phosphate oxidase family protein [Cyclobacteriaceae bacterium]